MGFLYTRAGGYLVDRVGNRTIKVSFHPAVGESPRNHVTSQARQGLMSNVTSLCMCSIPNPGELASPSLAADMGTPHPSAFSKVPSRSWGKSQ